MLGEADKLEIFIIFHRDRTVLIDWLGVFFTVFVPGYFIQLHDSKWLGCAWCFLHLLSFNKVSTGVKFLISFNSLFPLNKILIILSVVFFRN